MDARRRIEGGLEDQCLDQQGSASNELKEMRNRIKRVVDRGRTAVRRNSERERCSTLCR